MRYTLLIVLLLHGLRAAACDTLVYKGDNYRLINHLLDKHPTYHDAVDSLQRMHSGWCIDHYKAVWAVQHDSLFLIHLSDECPALQMQYGRLLGQGRTFAWWVDGAVYATDQQPLNCGFNSGIQYYEREYELVFSRGRLTGSQVFNYNGHRMQDTLYGHHVHNCSADTVLRYVYAYLDWAKVTEAMLDEQATVTIRFSTEQRYPWTYKTDILKTCCPDLDDDLRRAVGQLLFPGHYSAGKLHPFYYTLKLTFNHHNKARALADQKRSGTMTD